MASFTDSIPTFNPYVSQQPVEAMAQVGMAKQQQYDVNVQKIQQSMTEIAGLPVGRDVDKQYLEGKINDMTNKLKVYAAGDFSKNHLTTGVRSMVAGVADDEIVQNSVRSTMAAQAAKKLQSKYNEEGKGSPSNDWLLNTQLQEWYNNPEAGASFNGTYKPYQDYNAKTLKIVKQVLEDSQISEKDYYIDENNKVVFSDVSVTTEQAGIAKEKIQTALMAQLAPADWEQMQIDGRYQYSNVSGQEFAQEYQSSYIGKMEDLKKQRNHLVNKQKIASSPKEQARLAAMISDLDIKAGRENKEFSSINKMLETRNFEGAKAKLFTMNWMNNTGNAFSNSKTSETMKESPRASFAFKRQKEQRRMNEWNADYRMKNQHHLDDTRIAEERLKIDREKNSIARDANKISLQDLGTYGSISVGKDQKEIVAVTPGVLQAEVDMSKEIIENEKVEVGKYYVTEEQYKNSDYTNDYTYEEYAALYVDEQEDLYKKSPSAVKKNVRDFYDKKHKAERIASTKQEVKDKVVADSQALYAEKIASIVKDNQTTPIYFEDGSVMELSTIEILEFNRKYKEVVNDGNNISFGKYRTGPNDTYINEEKKNVSFNDKEKRLFEIRQKEENDLGGLSNDPKFQMTDVEQEVSDLIFDVKDQYGEKVNKILDEKIQFEKDQISSKLFAMQGKAHNIPLSTKQGPNGTQKDQFKASLMSLAEEADKMGGLANSPDVTGETIRNIIPDLDTAIITIVNDVPDGEDGTTDVYQITAMDKDMNRQSFRISPSQFDEIFPTQFRTTPELVKFNEYKKRIIAVNPENKLIGTTSKDGGFTNKDNAYLQNMDFPNVRFFGISGNVVSKDGQLYDLEVNFQNPISGNWHESVELDTDVSDVDLQNKMNKLSDIEIYEEILGRPVTEEDIKKLKEYAKRTDR